MTIWDFISRTTDSLKRNAPDLKAAKNLFSSVSGNASAAVTKLDDAVRTTFNHYVQEEAAHSNMVRIGTIVAKNATQEALKAIPGASVAYKIVIKSVQDFNNSDKLEVDAKAANMLTLEKKPLKTASYTIKHKQICQVQSCRFEGFKHSQQSSSCETESEDVIRVFMIKEFLGKQFFFPCLKLL